MLKNKKMALSFAIACVSASGLTLAQNNQMLEEVVVTAQKREQSLQDVPIAVQAVSGDTLEQNGIRTLSDLSSISPGFKIADTQSTDKVSALRGVNSFAYGFGLEESIPFYLDGVYLGNGFDMLGDLLDIQQVEVLKGPQGTLFGRNASGGAVNVITNKPSEEFEAMISATLGNYGLRTVNALLNTSLIDDTLYVRGGLSTRDRDGWQTNSSTGEKDGFEQDRSAGFMRFLWLAGESVEVEYSLDWSRQKDHSGYWSVNTVQPGSALWGFIWSQADPDSFFDRDSETAITGNSGAVVPLGGGLVPIVPAGSAPDATQDRKIVGNAVKLTWDLADAVTLTSISSYRKVDRETGYDADGGNLGLVNSWVEGTTKEINQELRLNGANDTVDWLVGSNYYKQEREEAATTFTSSLVSLSRLGLAGAFSNVEETSAGENETESYSLFADATWHITDAFNITTGIRYSYDEKTFDLIDANNSTFNGGGILYPNFSQLEDPSMATSSDDWSNISGRIGADYRFENDTMIYVSISQGYKSGGFNTRLTVEGNPVTGFISPLFGAEPFDEETNINYEIGLKSDLMDGSLRINSSLFRYVYKDLQTLLTDGNSPVARTVNAAEVTGEGWETEFIFLASDNLKISGNFLLLDAKYTKDVVDGQGTLRVESGQQRPWAPDWSATVAIDYFIDLGEAGELRTNLTYTMKDDEAQRATQVDEAYTLEDHVEEGYGLLNGRISFYSQDEKWEAAVWGRNILDEAYRTNVNASANSVAGLLAGIKGEPRTYGFDIKYRF